MKNTLQKLLLVIPLFVSSFPLMVDAAIVKPIRFSSHGDLLAGSLVLPENETFTKAVVFVHGSGEQKRSLSLAKHFAKAGIAALVYDKRGVGQSEGEYEGRQSVSEKNIELLADDAAAALNVLATHSATKTAMLGLTGISQAGWIVPLAAEKTDLADFIVLWSAPVCKVSEEDIFSKYTADKDTQSVPSFQQALHARKREYVWPDFLGKDSNPSDNLSTISIPGLWVFGAKDGSIPVDLSIERLSALASAGHEYEYVLFSKLGHNNMPESFATAVDWIHRLPENNDAD